MLQHRTLQPGKGCPDTLTHLLGAILIVLAVYLVWAQSSAFDYIHLDDGIYVFENSYVTRGLTAESVQWALTTKLPGSPHPLTWLSHMLDVELFGPGPSAPHVINYLLHAASSVLLFLIFVRATGAWWPSLMVALFFAIHPLRAESVTWVSERKDVLSTFFMFVTILFYVEYVRLRRLQGGYPALLYGAALTAFFLAILSKPMVVTLPVLLLLMDIWPLERVGLIQGTRRERILHLWRELWRLFLEKTPFLLLALGWSALCILSMNRDYSDSNAAYLVSFRDLSLLPRLLGLGPNYLEYLSNIVWPADLAVLYPHPGTWPLSESICAAVILLLLSAVLFYFSLKGWPFLGVGWLWFIIMILPVSGVLQNGPQSIADRYTYVSSVGITFAIVWSFYSLTLLRPRLRGATAALAFGAVAILTFLTMTTVATWRNSESLFLHTLAVTKKNHEMHSGLAAYYYGKGRFEEALEQALQAERLQPESVRIAVKLAAIYSALGQNDRAAELYEQILSRDPYEPTANYNLALLREKNGDSQGVLRLYFRSVHGGSYDSLAWLRLANSLLESGQVDAALQDATTALMLDPSSQGAAILLWRACAASSSERSWELFMGRLAGVPDPWQACLATGLHLLGQAEYAAAEKYFESSLRYSAGNPGAIRGLIEARIGQGKLDGLDTLAGLLPREPSTAHSLLDFSLMLSRQPSAEVRGPILAENFARQSIAIVGENSAFAWYVLAQALVSRGEYQKAVPIFQTAKSLAVNGGNEKLASMIEVASQQVPKQ